MPYLDKVQSGDPLAIPAATFNTFVDAAQEHLRRQRDHAGHALRDAGDGSRRAGRKHDRRATAGRAGRRRRGSAAAQGQGTDRGGHVAPPGRHGQGHRQGACGRLRREGLRGRQLRGPGDRHMSALAVIALHECQTRGIMSLVVASRRPGGLNCSTLTGRPA